MKKIFCGKTKIIFAVVFALCISAAFSFNALAWQTLEIGAQIKGYSVTRDGVRQKLNGETLYAGESFEILVTLEQNSDNGNYGGSLTFSFDSSVIKPDKTAYIRGTEGKDDYSYAVSIVSVPESKSGWTAELEREDESEITIGITDTSLTLLKNGETVSFAIAFTVLEDVKPGDFELILKSSELINGKGENVECSMCGYLFKVADKSVTEKANTKTVIIVSAVVVIAMAAAVVLITKRKKK